MAQVREAGLPRLLARFLGAQAAAQALWVLSWWLLGGMALSGRLDRGWLVAWLLLLLTLVSLRLVATSAGGELAIRGGAVLKRRLLVGSLNLEPDEVRHLGVGQLLGRVVESGALESMALTGGFLALSAAIELVLAGLVLGAGAGGRWHVALLLVAILSAAGLGRPLRPPARALDGGPAGDDRRPGRADGGPPDPPRPGGPGALARGGGPGARPLPGRLARPRPRGGGAPGARPAGLAARRPGGPGPRVPRRRRLARVAGRGGRRPRPGVSRLARPGRRPGAGRGGGGRLGTDRPVLAGGGPARAGRRPAVRRAPRPGPSSGRSLLDVRDLVFRHRDREEPVLRGVTVRIRAGDRLLLEGPSGGGKSTLAALLAGCRLPDAGLLLLDGLDRETLGAGGWRRRVVLAPQFHENHVFMGTLAFNALMGRDWPPRPADLDEAERVCRALGLGPLLDRMPAGLHQMVGETGWQLSHGEKGRLYIARALLQGADLLILDESFAALDPRTLRRTLACVEERRPTVLLIAHP